jgi:hypothetical protein
MSSARMATAAEIETNGQELLGVRARSGKFTGAGQEVNVLKLMAREFRSRVQPQEQYPGPLHRVGGAAVWCQPRLLLRRHHRDRAQDGPLVRPSPGRRATRPSVMGAGRDGLRHLAIILQVSRPARVGQPAFEGGGWLPRTGLSSSWRRRSAGSFGSGEVPRSAVDRTSRGHRDARER